MAALIVRNDFIHLRNLSTERKCLPDSQNQRREHQLLLENLHSYPIPYAIYDENDCLSVWNKPFEKLYSLVFDKLEDSQQAKGMSYADLQYANVEDELLCNEKKESLNKLIERQKQHRLFLNKSLDDQLVVDRHYPDTGWIRASKYREKDLINEVEQRKELEIEIRKIAYTDELTGIANRRHFMEKAELQWKHTIASNGEISVLMIDIDNFKSINDTFGHAYGDEVITTTAKVIATSLNSQKGICGRLGGEEFGVLLSDSSATQAAKLAEIMRSAMAGISFINNNHTFSVTISGGVTTCDDPRVTLAQLLKFADDALYASKRSGRNRVTIYDPDNTNEYQESGQGHLNG